VHSWSGPHGVPGDLERWEHGSYRWRRALEATAVMIAIILLAPWSVEIVAGACLMALGLLMLVWRVMPRRRARRHFDVRWPCSWLSWRWWRRASGG
jgi:hypothetical protein